MGSVGLPVAPRSPHATPRTQLTMEVNRLTLGLRRSILDPSSNVMSLMFLARLWPEHHCINPAFDCDGIAMRSPSVTVIRICLDAAV